MRIGVDGRGAQEDAQQSVGDCTYLPTFSIVSDMSSRIDARVLGIIRKLGVVRPVDLEKQGVPRAQLYELVRTGRVERQGRGLYVAKGHRYTADHALAQVAKRVPGGVVCLLSALRFHDLTTQLPAEVWVALPEKARRPRLDYPRLRVARFSGAALSEGIERHTSRGSRSGCTRPQRRWRTASSTEKQDRDRRRRRGPKDFTRTHRGGATSWRASRGSAACPG